MTSPARFAGPLGAVCVALSALPSMAAPPAPDGEILFRQRCQTCHSVVAAAPAGVGPNLKGVVGRPAASTSFTYSAALKQSKLVWTPANLGRYLTAPSKMVPGTRMVVSLPDPAQRAAVLAYLAKTR
jgi:cytochrome c